MGDEMPPSEEVSLNRNQLKKRWSAVYDYERGMLQ
jgi:hypothetical protein